MPAIAFGRKNENYVIITFHTNAIYMLIIPVSKWGLECKYKYIYFWPLIYITFGDVILQLLQQQHYRLTDQGFEYQQTQEIFLFYIMSSLALGFTQHPI